MGVNAWAFPSAGVKSEDNSLEITLRFTHFIIRLIRKISG